jgi:2-polyprenyl-3-methyl-5-hydroxy-6-metoxy-1,4-benzoquinol methylase
MDDKNFLRKTGLDTVYKYDDFIESKVILRDGREATIWMNKEDGHGILDPKFWEDSDFYIEEYRKEFSATLNEHTNPYEHRKIYKKTNKRQFNQFRKKINDNTKFLEIGCSFGGVLRHVDKFNIKKCDAIEPNKSDVEFLEKKVKRSNVINSFFENHNFEDKYNLVVSFEVLEHVIDLETFLSKLFKITEDDAFVNFEVPNHLDALLVNYKNPKYTNFYYHKSHVHYFTPKSLSKIFNKFGFDGEVSSFQMYPFYNQIFWMYNNSPQPSAKEALNYPKLKNESPTNHYINKFFKKTNKKYYKLMNENLCGDCLVFKGKKQKA